MKLFVQYTTQGLSSPLFLELERSESPENSGRERERESWRVGELEGRRDDGTSVRTVEGGKFTRTIFWLGNSKFI